MDGEVRDIAPEFYKESIEDEISKPSGLPEKPNVILIFTEGLSKSVVEDERNITPNLQKFSKRALSFENYYNHTFATYRGLIGQLYSGYQLNNSDSNNLIALQDIFSAKGYNTAFINTEPDNEEFTTYLTCGVDK
jgi:membrane-anchored protein YejM (alkaline phosphatase superfamily)